MTMVVVDANGEVTLQKALLERAGAHAGDTLEVEVRVVSPSRSDRKPIDWDNIAGMLKRPAGVAPLSIEEMNEVIAKGWAGELDDNA